MILRSIKYSDNVKSLSKIKTKNNFQRRELSLSTMKFISKYKTLKKFASMPILRNYIFKPPKPPSSEKMKTSM